MRSGAFESTRPTSGPQHAPIRLRRGHCARREEVSSKQNGWRRAAQPGLEGRKVSTWKPACHGSPPSRWPSTSGALSAIVAAVLLDVERMLFEGDANVAVGFHVETGASRIAATAMSINVDPPCAAKPSRPPVPPWSPHPATIRLRRGTGASRAESTSESIPTGRTAGVVQRTPAQRSGSFHVETSHRHRP